jgi:hypothetical protein
MPVLTLTGIDPEAFYPSSEAASLLHQREGTLASWRAEGRGPAYTKLGRVVLYQGVDLKSFIVSRRREPGAA